MKLIKVTSPNPVVSYIAETIGDHLKQGDSVLWLLSGGSAISIEVEVATRLRDLPVKTLTVSLVDERYGPVGHSDSNWQQLLDAGFDLPGATLLPVLTGKDQNETANSWGALIDRALDDCDYSLGLFGIGPDGHTSGILPHTPATSATGVAFAYDAGGYKRITTTVSAILRLDEAVVYAMGESKWGTLDVLKTDVSLSVQPAQLLKNIDKLTVFNDHTGELL